MIKSKSFCSSMDYGAASCTLGKEWYIKEWRQECLENEENEKKGMIQEKEKEKEGL